MVLAIYRILLLSTVFGLVSCDNSDNSSKQGDNFSPLISHNDNLWYAAGAKQVSSLNTQLQQINTRAGAAQNIILFIGDGMSLTTVTAARILEGQQQGFSGEENSLSFESFPFSGLAKTYAVDAQVPDSASTATAIMTGVKTDNRIVGLSEKAVIGDCVSGFGNELVSALDLAEIAGLSTGIVTSTRVTHATPAALYAKSAHRDWEDPSQMPQSAIRAGCEDIASQLVNYESNLAARFANAESNGIEVVMGGGQRHFLPAGVDGNVTSNRGQRPDNRNLVAEWQIAYPDGLYVDNLSDFIHAVNDDTERLLGLFNTSHLRYEADRKDKQLEPSLSDMTAKAIAILDNNPKGFFLMVEAGRIDHAHHAGNAYNALEDTIELSKAVKTAIESTDADNTLIIVTADHGHVFTMAGYPKRGNPILGKVVSVGDSEPTLAADNQPYTTLSYANGRGHRHLDSETNADAGYLLDIAAGRHDLSAIDTTLPGFYQEALVPYDYETHSGEDVPIYATGPGSHLITGSNEQTIIFHAINHAADLVRKARAALK
jgi:alkaline phosphatase